MKKWALSIAVTAGLIGLTACSGGGDSAAVVKTKAGDVTKDELYNAMKDRYGNQVVQELVYEEVLSEKYKVTDKQVNDQVDELKAQMGENFNSALTQAGYKDEAALKRSMKVGMLQEQAALKDVKVSENEMKEYYDTLKPEVQARHILVNDEKTAKEVKQKLDQGAKFEDLAKEYSQDPGSAEKGGDLGWFGAGQMVPEFENATYALKKDEISGPVKSENGFHIIQLLDKKEKKPYNDMKKQIEKDLKSSKLDEAKVQKAMDDELKNADVTIEDKDLKDALKPPEAPPAAPAPQQ
ncbi:peptidylprolyl isomerase [Peribacillus cavernae]|uniref:Foldase protein PrsA n=1 Tax=Peribacillus cavernae TaxID=1674310 RepID=A0A3S0W0I0_9BACI|nr:peptidylprolyl isomerase [Peribacillus cavernae]MDQ0217615.1 foldase protein PrsA [Peribacillus cavernae]RUQ29956.1 peptidylprolyl isomerase [Peribacillus cavernae]